MMWEKNENKENEIKTGKYIATGFKVLDRKKIENFMEN